MVAMYKVNVYFDASTKWGVVAEFTQLREAIAKAIEVLEGPNIDITKVGVFRHYHQCFFATKQEWRD
jgi:hypothetical protein